VTLLFFHRGNNHFAVKTRYKIEPSWESCFNELATEDHGADFKPAAKTCAGTVRYIVYPYPIGAVLFACISLDKNVLRNYVKPTQLF
jgi:hypothetical protein